MKILTPFQVEAEDILDSNVPITEIEWSAGTFTLGQQRYIGAILYEVVAASTTESPTTGINSEPPTWIEIGTINRFSAFDGILGRPSTVASGTMEWEVQADGFVNGIALFGISAEDVTLRVIRPDTEAVLFERTYITQGRGQPGNLWEWFFNPFKATLQIIETEIPTLLNPIVEIEVNGGGGPASLGECLIGEVDDLGTTLVGSGVEIEDFTRKTRDQFGNFVIAARPSSRLVRYSVLVDRSDLPRVEQLLRARLAEISVFIGTEGDPTLTVAGYPRSIQMPFTAARQVEMFFEVEGII